MDNGCDRCLWSGQCSDEFICEHFTPLEEELIDDVVEWNRYKFREEWFRFVEEEWEQKEKKRYGETVNRTAVYI